MEKARQFLQSWEETANNYLETLPVNMPYVNIWILIGLVVVLLLLAGIIIRALVKSRKKVGQLDLEGEPLPEIEQEIPAEPEEGDIVGEVPYSTAAADSPPLQSTEAAVLEEAEVLPPFEEEPEEKFFQRLKGRLSKTQSQFIGRLDQVIFKRKSINSDMLDELEEILVTADLGVKTSYQLLGDVQQEIDKKSLAPETLKDLFKQKMAEMLAIDCADFDSKQTKPFVIMVVGVNGVGKTTTIGKLAARLKKDHKNIMLVAGDTFRAAAIEQLQIWSQRTQCDFIRHKHEADPSAVAYDAIQAARARDTDVVIIDTAGRLHTKTNLMEELKKIKRVIGKEFEGAPHEIILVLDATSGQNAINQARIFHEALGVTGIVLTKLDGTAKGGVIVGITHELQLPVRFIGIGEGIEDLKGFNPQLFLDALFAVGNDPNVQ